MPNPPHDSGGGGSGGGSRGPAIKRKGRGRRCALRVRPGAVRQNVPAWRGRRQAEPAGEREAVPSREPPPPSLPPARPPAGIPGGAAAPGRAAPSAGLRGGGTESGERGSRAAGSSSRRLSLRHRPGQRRWQCRSQEQELAEIVLCVRDYEECTHD
ncbi:uncharacterized protein RBU47_017536 isoform 1-T3 [Passerculus sandwichensis]